MDTGQKDFEKIYQNNIKCKAFNYQKGGKVLL